MKHLLITGFDPFGGEAINPAWEAVSRLPDAIGDFRLTKLQIPTVFGTAAEAVLTAARSDPPEAILCVGLAAGRAAVTPERIAVNIRDARPKGTRDNAGHLAEGEFCVPGGPAAYFSTLPPEDMARAIRWAGLPAEVSNSAGTFVCNDTLYLLLHEYAQSDVRVGFIHVPRLSMPDAEVGPCMSLADIIQALSTAIRSIG